MSSRRSQGEKARSTTTSAPHVACYSIQVAARLTGLGPATLRKWEERYGFPLPERREGGSRLYSEADIVRLRLIARALEKGHRAGDVVPRSPDELARMLAIDGERSSKASELGAPSLDDVLDALSRDDLAALDEGIARARRTLGPRRFVTEFAHPLNVRVGEAWSKGIIDVRHEHVLTNLLSREIASALSERVAPHGHPLVALATPPRELHAISLDLTALYLTTLGVTTLVLGAETPAEELVRAAIAHRADAVGVSFAASFPPTSARDYVARLVDLLPPRTPIWIGGAGGKSIRETARCLRIEAWLEIDDAVAQLRRGGVPSGKAPR